MESMMNILQVGKVLGLTPANVIELVRRGDLRCYRTMGGAVGRDTVSSTTRGLRFRPSDVREYLDSVAIR